MSSLLPLEPTPPSGADRDIEPRLVDFEDDDAEEVLSAISSTTARRILGAVYDEPRTASDLAAQIDTSVQNVSYHLDRLCDADLLEVIETWYSEQGREMAVYGPTSASLVLYTGARRATPSLDTALRRVLGGTGLVGLASVVVHERWAARLATPTRRALPPTPEPTLGETLSQFATGPGGTVLVLGLLAIGALFGRWYVKSYLPAREEQTPA